jgi:hypothetical protein
VRIARPGGCRRPGARGAAGTHWLAPDTSVSGGVELTGEYLLAVLVDR